jgi:hypothetical protein
MVSDVKEFRGVVLSTILEHGTHSRAHDGITISLGWLKDQVDKSHPTRASWLPSVRDVVDEGVKAGAWKLHHDDDFPTPMLILPNRV